MADQFGYRKGAKGIDGRSHEGYHEHHVDKGAQKRMYGAAANLGGVGTGSDGTFGGQEGQGSGGKSPDKMAKGAVKGERSPGKAKR